MNGFHSEALLLSDTAAFRRLRLTLLIDAFITALVLYAIELRKNQFWIVHFKVFFEVQNVK